MAVPAVSSTVHRQIEQLLNTVRELTAMHAITTRQVETLTARVAALELARGPRDDADSSLLIELYDAIEGRAFGAGAAMIRAQSVPRLAKALLAADIVNEKQLGKLLARMNGTTIADDIVIQRAALRGRLRRAWRFGRVTRTV